MANKFLDKTPKEYLKTGFWLWLNNVLTGIIVSIIWWVLIAILVAVGIATQVSLTDMYGLMQAGIIVILLALVMIIFALFVSGVIFDKLIRKRV